MLLFHMQITMNDALKILQIFIRELQKKKNQLYQLVEIIQLQVEFSKV